MNPETLTIQRDAQDVLTVTLARPEVRNAFNDVVIRELHAVFTGPAAADDVRVVVIRGAGKSFCAGADLNWMKAGVGLGFAENEADALRMARMFEAVADCPAPVVALVHGHALGGGAGLVAAADVALVNAEAKLGFTEVRLGIIPAVISPFVLRKIGETHARRYFLTGEVFSGTEAERIGLAQRALPADELESALEELVQSLLASGPRAVREAKSLVAAMVGRRPADVSHETASWIARLRGESEGQEGMKAFLEKRSAQWVPGGDA